MNTMTISSGIPRPIKAPFTGGYIADSTTFVLAALLAAGFALQPAYAQFASGVSVVEVYASVVDLRGEPVTNLDQSDFIVTENGAQQQIAVFTPGNFPLSVAIGVDRSFSMAGANLAAAKSGARLFLAELRPEDEASVLAIGSQVETVAPLSRDRAAQLNAVDKLDAFGTTGLYDSVSKAIQIMQTAKGRRALVLLSDGNDRYSRSTPDAALALARKSDVMVYPIALGSQTSPFFLQIASMTGGRAFQLRDPARLGPTLRVIARELRFQYLLGYTPKTSPAAGEWRRLRVTVRRMGMTVRAREGYFGK